MSIWTTSVTPALPFDSLDVTTSPAHMLRASLSTLARVSLSRCAYHGVLQEADFGFEQHMLHCWAHAELLSNNNGSR